MSCGGRDERGIPPLSLVPSHLFQEGKADLRVSRVGGPAPVPQGLQHSREWALATLLASTVEPTDPVDKGVSNPRCDNGWEIWLYFS